MKKTKALTDRLEKVAGKVLQKLDGFVDTVEPERLNPQSMKHITATLKDIRDLGMPPVTDAATTVHVIFDGEEDWRK